VFQDNFATYNGGAIYLDSADIVIHHSTFMNNRCGLSISPWGYGGAVCSDHSNPDIRWNEFLENSSTGVGGGLAVRFEDCNVYNNYFSGNLSALGGGLGILHVPEINYRVNNNLLVENSAIYFGGGVASLDASPVYINNTIAFNSSVYGGGFYCKDSISPDFYNTVFWGNTAAVGPTGYLFEVYSQADFFNCVVEGGPMQFGGSGGGEAFFGTYEQCIDLDPEFLGTGEFPYQPDPDSSPCIDTGTPDTSGFFLPETDLAGLPRFWSDFIDMGAYEAVWEGVDEEDKGGRGEEGNSSGIRIWPNPTPGVFRLQSSVFSRRSSVGGQRSAVIEIIDIYGKVAETHNNLTIEQLNNGSVSLDISHLPYGIYFLKLEAEGQVFIGKIVKGFSQINTD
jgi:predicted outer membrane repeat protein